MSDIDNINNITITEVADPSNKSCKFDPTKPVQTRDGRKARILATDAERPDYPIIALVRNPSSGHEAMRSFTAEGFSFSMAKNGTLPDDLVNVPDQLVVDYWLNLYRNGASERFSNEENAIFHRGFGAVTVHIQKTFNV